MTTTNAVVVHLNSSTLASAGYDPLLAKLELRFCDGTLYEYSGVATEIFRGLLLADSKGAYFNQHIRGHYPHVKMPVEN